jgi:hypothetical protein
MEKIMKRVLIIVLMSLCLMGCGPENVDEGVELPYDVSVYRYIDGEAGAVCWVYYTRGGISCLPISDTILGE